MRLPVCFQPILTHDRCVEVQFFQEVLPFVRAFPRRHALVAQHTGFDAPILGRASDQVPARLWRPSGVRVVHVERIRSCVAVDRHRLSRYRHTLNRGIHLREELLDDSSMEARGQLSKIWIRQLGDLTESGSVEMHYSMSLLSKREQLKLFCHKRACGSVMLVESALRVITVTRLSSHKISKWSNIPARNSTEVSAVGVLMVFGVTKMVCRSVIEAPSIG